MNLQRVELYVNGVTLRPIHVDFEKGFVTYTYSRLGNKHSISPDDFKRGYIVYRIKNTPGDSSSDEYKPIGVRGHSRLELQFAKPLKSSFVVFIQGSVAKHLTISNARAVEVIDE